MKNLIILFMLIIFMTAGKIGLAQQDFEVTGIMGGDHPVAIINGEVVQKGSKIDQAEVVDISDNSVTLKYQDQLIVKSPGQDINERTGISTVSQKMQDIKTVARHESAVSSIDKQIQERINDEYERNRQIDLDEEAKEEAEKERKLKLKLEEIDAQAYVDAAQGRLYDGKTDGYERSVLREEQQEDDKAQEDSE